MEAGAGEAEIAAEAPGALMKVGAGARAAVARRARHVYRMPDGSVWDGAMYAEFRAALADYDNTRTRVILPTRARAWGFAEGRRAPARAGERPDPLWHSLQRPPAGQHPSFIYVNASSETLFERGQRPRAQVAKVHHGAVVEVNIKEFPGDEHMRLPASFLFGSAHVAVLLPTGVGAREGGALRGEFFLVRDSTIERPRGLRPELHMYRYVHAHELRMTPEQYAAALLAGEAELVEWSFKRDRSRPEGGFVWTRRVVDVRADGPESGDAEAVPEADGDAAPE